ncbi:MAG: DegQ family serine endoprotease [Cellvibrionaceae bacterium]|nr:DegQ family serine endoprotease [Cellvibrionaceae bacterium]
MQQGKHFNFFSLLVALAAGFFCQLSQANTLPSLAPMLEDVNSAVVNISTYSKKQNDINPLLKDPFFRRFFNIPNHEKFKNAPQLRQRSAGSGVIVDADKGIIITNHHVVKESDEVRVALNDGRSFDAEIVGSDPDLDISILQIEAKNLTELRLANSSKLRIGDFVVAIGNPFGLGQTVTTGIVSALGRTGLGIEGYENFIQTDASINPGNSGGALVNLRGELVGINTAIIAPSGGNVGIGFAIPINMASASMRQIIDHGEVKRGQIGVGIQDITPDLRKAFDLENGQQGVLVNHVEAKTPAEAAGMESGDIIIAVNGEDTESTGQLRSQIGLQQIGDTVELTVLRNAEKIKLKVKVGEPVTFSNNSRELHPLLEGALFADTQGEGVEVTKLRPNSPASYGGLRVGDLILAANRQQVNDLKSLINAVRKDSDSILLHIERDGRSLYLVIR